MKKKPKRVKPQYSLAEGRRLVRKDFLLPREEVERLARWHERTGLSEVDLVRRAITKELDAEGIPRKGEKR